MCLCVCIHTYLFFFSFVCSLDENSTRCGRRGRGNRSWGMCGRLCDRQAGASLSLSHSFSCCSFTNTQTHSRLLVVCLFCVPCFIVYGIVAVLLLSLLLFLLLPRCRVAARCVVFKFVIIGLVFPSSARADADSAAATHTKLQYAYVCVCLHDIRL